MRDATTLQFRFKGDRHYVHGTDIYNALHEVLTTSIGNLDNIDLSFHKISTQHMKGYIYRNEQVFRTPNTVAFFAGQSQENAIKVVLEEDGETVTERYPYEEEHIGLQAAFNLNTKEIRLNTKLAFTDIELYVALNKVLLQELYPAASGKWYFTRIQLNHFNKYTDYKSVSIKFVNNFNLSLTKSAIYIDDKQVGSIYFSLVKQ